MRQDTSTSSWKTNLFLVASTAAAAIALITKWRLEKNTSPKNEQKNAPLEKAKTKTDSSTLTFEQLEALSDGTVFQNMIERSHSKNTAAEKDQAHQTVKITTPAANTQKNKTPESTLAQAKLPLTGTAAPMLSHQSSYSVLPSHATSSNELDELNTPRTPCNSQEKMTGEIEQRKAELLQKVEPDRAAWPTQQKLFATTMKESPKKAAPTTQAAENKKETFWPFY